MILTPCSLQYMATRLVLYVVGNGLATRYALIVQQIPSENSPLACLQSLFHSRSHHCVLPNWPCYRFADMEQLWVWPHDLIFVAAGFTATKRECCVCNVRSL
jgi:hypothetical protein